MAVRNPSTIRNLLLAGHAGSGKTLLTERLLNAAGATNRMGSIEDGNTVTDWTEDAKKHGHSLASSLAHYERNDNLVTLLDTPGLADFFGQTIAALPAAGVVAVVIDASKGIETGTWAQTFASATSLRGQASQRAAVLDALERHTWFHFAGHADRTNAWEAGLRL
ncbi:MAG: GTP-binding protein, partial [Phycisphaerales bacterium JB060]